MPDYTACNGLLVTHAGIVFVPAAACDQVDFSPQQAEAYKTLLVRNFDVLADPKPPR